MNRQIFELTAISLVSFASLCLAWAYEADLFAIVFAAATLIAAVSAVQRAL